MAVFTEVIKLDDQVSAPAKAASGAVQGLGTSTATTQGALAKATTVAAPAGAAMKSLGQSTFDASNAMKVGKETISAAITGIKSAFTSLAQGDVKGAIQGVTDAVAGIAKMLDLVVPGLGQAVSAVIQIAGGLLGVTVGLIKSGADFAIASSQAKTQMLAMFDALGAGVMTGAQVDDMLDGLSAKLGVTKDAMVPLVQKFMAMGITSQDALEKMTTAALSAKALVGGADSGAAAFEALAKKIQLASETGQGLKIPIKGLGSLAEMGLTVDDVAKKMGISAANLAGQLKDGTADAKKFGDALQSALIDKGAGPLQKMGLGLSNLKSLFSQYIGDMFEDLGDSVGPFLLAVKDLFSIFDSKSKPSGEALKAGIGGFFKQVFAAATKVVPMIKHFLLDVIIYGLRAYIAIKPIVAKIREFATSAQGMKIINTALQGLWFVLKVIGVSILVVIGAIGLFVAALVAISVAAYTVVGAIVDFVSTAGGALADWVSGAATAAYDFVAGLVQGISDGAGAVMNAVSGLADKATGAFKSALGIASPSKVMMGLGGNVAEGTAEGIEAGSKDVHGASSGMAAAAVKGATSSGDESKGSDAKSGANVIVYVTVEGASKSVLEISQEMWSQIMQRAALESGL